MFSHVSAIEDGVLQVVLSLCEYEMPVSLLSVRILGLIVEHPGTHQTVAENNRNTIPRILQLIASEDEQVKFMTLVPVLLAFLEINEELWLIATLVNLPLTYLRTIIG